MKHILTVKMSVVEARTPRKNKGYSRTTAELHKNRRTGAKTLLYKDYSYTTTTLNDTA